MAEAYQCDICKKLFTKTNKPAGTFKIGVKRTSKEGVTDSPITGRSIFNDEAIFYDVCPSCLDAIAVQCSILRAAKEGEEDNG